jgi:hypothetical protein
VKRLAFAAESFQRQHRRWPAIAELTAADATLPARDPWGCEYVVDHDGELAFGIRSAGVDGVPATADDIRSPTIRAPN